jgi:hypothetical protein
MTDGESSFLRNLHASVCLLFFPVSATMAVLRKNYPIFMSFSPGPQCPLSKLSMQNGVCSKAVAVKSN